MNSVNFGREKSLTPSGREFQILGPNVLRFFSLNVIVFALLATKSCLLLAECESFLNYGCMKSGCKDFKVLKTVTTNLRKQFTSIVGCATFNDRLL